MAPRKDLKSEAGELLPVDRLRVDLGSLDEGAHPLAVELPATWVAEILGETDAIVDQGGVARLEIMLQADLTVLVRGALELDYVVPCARCLGPAKIDVGSETGELCVTYIPAERLRSWAEYSGAPGDEDEIEPLDPAELDELGYDGKIVDLRGLVSEQVLLAYPMRALCERGESCRGLCPKCGADLNKAADAVGGEAPAACPNCKVRLSPQGIAIDEDKADSPWKRALAKVSLDDESS